jgi:FKBP-type peptidyl-prolyl cis-trans isomerase FklB
LIPRVPERVFVTRTFQAKKEKHMKLSHIAVLILGAALTVSAAEQTPALKDQKDKLSYSIGMDIGRTFKRQSIDVNPEVLLSGLKDVLSSNKTLLTDEEQKETIAAWQNELRAKQNELRAKQTETIKQSGEKNKKEGEAFLAENKKKSDVVTLPSGLQYKIVTAGTGPKPTSSDTVLAHYRGSLIDGTEFDSSYRRGEPMNFGVTQVIKGWQEALQLMPVGSKWQLFIPSDIAYGERGYPPKIGPNATLLFDIELVSIQPSAATAKPAVNPNAQK